MKGKGVSGDRYISIVRLSPFSLPDPGRRYIVIKAYYDGGNKSHEDGYMTLAGIAATEATWPEFERHWGETLAEHGLQSWHTADAMSSKGRRDFLRPAAGGWDSSKAQAAMEDLSKVIYGFHERHWQANSRILTCTINLRDYRKARERNRWLRPAEAICVNVCIGGLNNGPMLLYFDRGEEFMKEVERVWRKDIKKPWLKWPQQIKAITAIASHDSYPLQAADLLAWTLNRGVGQASERGIAKFTFCGITHYYYDLEEIEAEYTIAKEQNRIRKQMKAGRQVPLGQGLSGDA